MVFWQVVSSYIIYLSDISFINLIFHFSFVSIVSVVSFLSSHVYLRVLRACTEHNESVLTVNLFVKYNLGGQNGI